MAKLQKNNVIYQNVQVPAKTTGAIIGHSPYLDENGNPANSRYEGFIQEPTPFINVIDIDWNNATCGNTTINSTEDLISTINSLNLSIEGKVDSTNVYTKNEVDAMLGEVETIKGDTGAQGIQGSQGSQGMQGVKGDQGTKGEQGIQGSIGIQGAIGAAGMQGSTGAQGIKGSQGMQGVAGIQGAIGAAGMQGSTGAQGLKGSQGIQGIAGIQGTIGAAGMQGSTGAQGIKGSQGMQGVAGIQGLQGIKGDTGTFDSSELESYATKTYVDSQIAAIIGGEDVSANFDTLKEVADALSDLKVVDVEAVPGIEGEHYTQEEIDAAQEGDEAYGKTVDDWKVEPVEAIEEQSHNMTIGEFVNTSIQTVDEKAAVAKLQAKYEALLSILNVRESQVNSVIINQELEENSNVTFNEPVENVVIPQTTAVYTVSAPLEDDSTVTLISNKYMTLFNTNEEAVNVTVQQPLNDGDTGTSGTTVYLVGEYDTLTLENVSPNVKSGQDPAKVNNVVITEDNTKNLTLTLDIQDGATITNNSSTNVTITDKNNESTVLTIVAPNSTVTLSGSNYEVLNAEVSDNTLIIKKTAHIGTLNVTKGNVTVEVPRQSDIANIIDNVNVAQGYTIDYLHDEITSSNVSKLTTTGTHTLTEDIDKNGRFAPGVFASDDIVWNLNNHNITFTNTQGYANFLLRGTLHLEINGDGIIRNNANDYGFWAAADGVNIVVNGGTYYAATHVLYAEKGIIEVNGGEFHLTDEATAEKDDNDNFKFLLNCKDENYTSGKAQIIVKGGTFYGFNPAITYGEPGGPVSYVAEGYESVQTGTYTYTDGNNNEVTMKIYTVNKIV